MPIAFSKTLRYQLTFLPWRTALTPDLKVANIFPLDVLRSTGVGGGVTASRLTALSLCRFFRSGIESSGL